MSTTGAPSVAISVVILARDESRHIEACVRTARWADEVLVVDGGSEDDTAARARAAGARVVCNAWPGFAEQRRFALREARHPWVFSLDADERIPEELAREVRDRAGRESFAGYRCPRANHFLGRRIRGAGWHEDRVLRLMRRESARVTAARVHEGYEVDGAVGLLKGALHHRPYDGIHHYYGKMNAYTSLEVEDKAARLGGRRVGPADLLARPAARFWRMYVGRRGFRDGRRGFVLCTLASIYLFVLYAKIWERQRAR